MRLLRYVQLFSMLPPHCTVRPCILGDGALEQISIDAMPEGQG